MASSPRFKVYSATGEYLGSLKDPELAAAVVGLAGAGATIRDGHRLVVWIEGAEDQAALDSYDFVAETVYGRMAR